MYAPTRGRFKVYMIDEVHMLSKLGLQRDAEDAGGAAGAREVHPGDHRPAEDSGHGAVALPAVQPEADAAGRRSCRTWSASSGEEKVDFEKEALSLIARAAAGSMRDALSLLDQAIAHGGGRVAAGAVGEMLGAIDQSYLVRLLECVAGDDASGAVAIADEMQSRSLSFDAALADLASLLLRMALAQSVAGALDELAEPERLAALAGKLDPESLQLYYQIALQGREDLPLAPDEHARLPHDAAAHARVPAGTPGQRHCGASGANREGSSGCKSEDRGLGRLAAARARPGGATARRASSRATRS